MKITLSSIVFLFITNLSLGQGDYPLDFEGVFGYQSVTIDAVSNINNVWAIGSPQKTIFTSAFSVPNVIVTDTANPYPTNDTSSFIITNIAGAGFDYGFIVGIYGMYMVNSDSLTDYGTMEFSPDHGSTWIDLINTTTYASNIQWLTPKPVLTGSSSGWQNFNVRFGQLGPLLGINWGDTVLYRFTFISDNVQTNKDGLMYDHFYFEDYIMSVEEYKNDNLISAFPNPASNELNIKSKNYSLYNSNLEIYNMLGEMIYSQKTTSELTSINISNFKKGIYFVSLNDGITKSRQKFIKN